MSIWAEEFRPKSIADVIIPDSVKEKFNSYIADKEIPNLLFTSPNPGTGKTTTARALGADIGIERPLFINASLNNSIDDIRMVVTQYATTVSLYGDNSHKLVILDEADRLSVAAQDALKGLIEEVHSNCRFILTANTKSRLTDPIVSRLIHVDFRFNKEDEAKLNARMFKRCTEILEAKGVTYNKVVLAHIVKKMFPDNRSLLQFLQSESASGPIDEGTLARLNSASPEALVEAMKAKKYGDVTQWMANNADKLHEDFYDRLRIMLTPKLADQSIPEMIMILGDDQNHFHNVPSKFIHFTAMVTKLMMTVAFK